MRVKGSMFTHDIHITFQRIVRRSTERVEKFADNRILVTKVQQEITVSVDLFNVVKLCIRNDTDCVWERL